MAAKKPRIVIVGAGMAGLTAANRLYSFSKGMFEVFVVEGGNRIGGRVHTSEFCGDRIELGATWIHGIGGSPIYKIALETHALESDQPWECMDPCLEDPKVVLEGCNLTNFQVNQSLVESIATLFNNLMAHALGRKLSHIRSETTKNLVLEAKRNGGVHGLSIGSYLRRGLDLYWDSVQNQADVADCGDWSRKMIEEAVFVIHENMQRTYTSAGDLMSLDFEAESEYQMFPDEEITIARGYLSIIESLASVLPHGVIQLGRKVARIDWQKGGNGGGVNYMERPVKVHLCDGSVLVADHVIVTVSLGVLKAGSGMFNPPLPFFKADAISRLGFGVVNKLFLQRSNEDCNNIPFLQMGFHRFDSKFRDKNIPWWMRRTAAVCPIYKNSSVLLSWFAGNEAVELERLADEDIIHGVSATLSSFLPHKSLNGKVSQCQAKFSKVLRTKWSCDPLFLGSYSYVAVGSSGEEFDKLAEPLPRRIHSFDHSKDSPPPLQILFAGEATHRTHYSTTHGAYFSGLREANRLLKHYNCVHGV